MDKAYESLVNALAEGELEGYRIPPEPYNERSIPLEEREWVYDYGERAVPLRRGFVTDFVYHTRGFETPTLSVVWSALYIMASAIKREAWIKWVPRPLYPNLYMLVIGPAGRVKKTTAVVDIGLPILEGFQRFVRDVNISRMKTIVVLKDKATPEAMLEAMLPENRPGDDHYIVQANGEFVTDRNGKAVVYRKTSETSIVISELSTFLTKRSYGEGTLQLLIDLYDARDTWEWRTMSKGVKYLRKTCTSFVAGTTVDGMRNSIPAAAMGDGFMSRAIPVYVPHTKRRYPMPSIVKGAPTTDELQRRLAWVCEKGVGEFRLSKEAQKTYEKWYAFNHIAMERNPGLSGAMSRMSTNLLKVALLLRLNRYDGMGPEIELEDLEDAIRLMDVTYSSMPFLLSQLDPDVIMSEAGRLYDFVERHGKIKRRSALSSLRIRADLLTAAVEELCARGVMKVLFEGKSYAHPAGRTEEEYVYVEDKDDRTREDRGPGTATSLSYTSEVWDDTNGCLDDWCEPHSPTEVSPEKPSRPKGSRGRPASTPNKKTKKHGAIRSVATGKPRGRPPKKHEGN